MDFTHLITGIQKRFAALNKVVNISDCLLCESHITQSRIGLLCHVCYQDLIRYPLGFDILKHNPNLAAQIQHEYVDGYACIAKFQWPYDILIKQLKYGKKLNRARTLGGLLAEHVLQTDWPAIDYICPLPLHVNKQAQRGFNQSEVISQFVKKDLDVTLFKGLTRIKNTRTQTELNRKERMANVKNAFSCNKELQSKRILLIDDVLTTGATLEQAGKALKLCGAKQVFAATIAVRPLS